MAMLRCAALTMLVLALGCRRERPASANLDVPEQYLSLAHDALRAAAEVKMSGHIDSVLAQHPHAERYSEALTEHFALMKKLHAAAAQSRIRYTYSRVIVQPQDFCIQGDTATLRLNAMVAYGMESIPAGAGTPPETSGEQEHIFEFRRSGSQWVITRHHEVSLGELHDPERLRRLRAQCSG